MVVLGRAFLSEATTNGPNVIFGTKVAVHPRPQWSTVPPPLSASFASSPSASAKFAERIEGGQFDGHGQRAALLPFLG